MLRRRHLRGRWRDLWWRPYLSKWNLLYRGSPGLWPEPGLLFRGLL